MSQSREFIVKSLLECDSGHLTVIGRCGDEPIRVNDVFDLVFRDKKRNYPDEYGDEPVREEERPMHLRVECIHAYERSLDLLGQGMTGSLRLKGEGGQYIMPGWILASQSRSDSPY